MAERPWEIVVNEDTPADKLELCVLYVEGHHDINAQRVASKAKVELKRRDREFEKERFNLESKERTNSQKFQQAERFAAQEFQEGQTDKQLKIADKNLLMTKIGALFAALSAIAAIALVYLTAVK